MEEKNLLSIEIKDKEKRGNRFLIHISLILYLTKKRQRKELSYGKADYRLFLGIKNRGIYRTRTFLKRISRPGLRIYANYQGIPKVLGGMGIAILSTSRGIMTDREARLNRIGGEVLCYIW